MGISQASASEPISRLELEVGSTLFTRTSKGLSPEPAAEELAQAKLVLYDAHAGWKDPTRRQLQTRARLAGLSIEGQMEVEHAETAYDLVVAGAGESFMARGILASMRSSDRVRSFSFADPLYDRIALVQRKHGYLSPATRRFSALAQQAVAAQKGLTSLVEAAASQ